MRQISCNCCDEQFFENESTGNTDNFCETCLSVFFESRFTAADASHSSHKKWLAENFPKHKVSLITRINQKLCIQIKFAETQKKTLPQTLLTEFLKKLPTHNEPVVYTDDPDQQSDFIAICFAAANILRNCTPAHKLTSKMYKNFFESLFEHLITILKEVYYIPENNSAVKFVFHAYITVLWKHDLFEEAIKFFNQKFSLPYNSNRQEIDFHGFGYASTIIASILFLLKEKSFSKDVIIFIVGQHGGNIVKAAVIEALQYLGFPFVIPPENQGRIHIVISQNANAFHRIATSINNFEQQKLQRDRTLGNARPAAHEDFSNNESQFTISPAENAEQFARCEIEKMELEIAMKMTAIYLLLQRGIDLDNFKYSLRQDMAYHDLENNVDTYLNVLCQHAQHIENFKMTLFEKFYNYFIFKKFVMDERVKLYHKFQCEAQRLAIETIATNRLEIENSEAIERKKIFQFFKRKNDLWQREKEVTGKLITDVNNAELTRAAAPAATAAATSPVVNNTSNSIQQQNTYKLLEVLKNARCDWNLAATLIRNGADVNVQNQDLPLICFLAQQGKNDMIQLCLNRGADINARTLQNANALHIAINHANLALIKILLARNIDANAQLFTGETALHFAARMNLVEAIRLMWEAGVDFNLTMPDGGTALHIAAYYGHAATVKFLISCDANLINKKTIDGKTALFVAADNEKRDVVELLINAGADVDLTTDDDGTAPLHIAAHYGYSEIAIMLINASAKSTAIKNGTTPLHLAANEGDKEIVAALLRTNVDIDAVTVCGKTALDYAHPYPDIVKLITDAKTAQASATKTI